MGWSFTFGRINNKHTQKQLVFSDNTATQGGVLFTKQSSSVNINESQFISNYAVLGAIVHTSEKTLIQIHNVTIRSNVAKLAIIYFIESIATFSGKTFISNNVGSLVAEGSSVNVMGSAIFFDNLAPILDSSLGILSEAGAITAFQSNIHFSGSCSFAQNSASEGGAVFAFESSLFIYDRAAVTIARNNATMNGSGLYLERTLLDCQGENVLNILANSAGKNGGGIHAVGSSLTVNYLCERSLQRGRYSAIFAENTARKGGAIFLEMDAKLYIVRNCHGHVALHNQTYILLKNNSANYGGAIFVADNTNSGTCVRSPLQRILSTTSECFFQLVQSNLANSIITQYSSKYYQSSIQFSGNYASNRRTNLYGGLLDRCTLMQCLLPSQQ